MKSTILLYYADARIITIRLEYSVSSLKRNRVREGISEGVKKGVTKRVNSISYRGKNYPTPPLVHHNGANHLSVDGVKKTSLQGCFPR
jgi:predicted transcriptional regulator of viral defense system